MTLAGKLVTLFPIAQLGLTLGSLYYFVAHRCFVFLGLAVFFLYFLPIIIWRIHAIFSPLKLGESDIFGKFYSPWWTCHQLQMLYMAMPFLEAVLRIIPGCYSLWLRAWGSKIGKNVYWTPGVIVYDRNLLDIGDNVIIGEKAIFVAHIISPKNGTGVLELAVNKVENRAFIGAACCVSPGCLIREGALLKVGVELYPHSIYGKGGLEAGKIRGQK
jgi:acetyltransferase-like isoleucine patch superfamily enzyme